MKRLLLAMAALLAASNALGTGQIPEYFVHKGEKIVLDAAPLESMFDKNHPRPNVLYATSSACWRGYVGTWFVHDGHFCLKSLVRPDFEFNEETKSLESRDEPIPLEPLFGQQKLPVKATWYSGVLRCTLGEPFRRDPFFGSSGPHERELYITVKQGKVLAVREIDNRAEGATLSQEDIEWVQKGGGPVADDGNWQDARLIEWPTEPSTEPFVTRGILVRKKRRKPSYLYIPSTPTTSAVKLVLKVLPINHGAKTDDHVEIKARFEKKNGEMRIRVESLRRLKPGETIHHPKFKAPAKETQPA